LESNEFLERMITESIDPVSAGAACDACFPTQKESWFLHEKA